jgi:superfamily I DNA/RNA helicase
MNECKTVSDLMSKIQMLFDDNNRGVVFSSVHRAKGLEAKNVFILRPDLMPHPKAGMGKDKKPDPKKQWELVQESNGQYVAWTRSNENLYFVKGGQNDV